MNRDIEPKAVMSPNDIYREVYALDRRLVEIEIALERKKISSKEKEAFQKEAELLKERWAELKRDCPHPAKDRLTGDCSICG